MSVEWFFGWCFFLIVRIFSSSSSSRVCLLIVWFFSRLLAVCLTVLFSQKNWDDFRSCLQFREQKPTGNGKQERARNGNARASRACAGAGRAQIKTIRSCVFTEKNQALNYVWRSAIDGFWIFADFLFAPKSPSFILLFEIVIRSKREYKVVHCVNLTIFFLLVVA